MRLDHPAPSFALADRAGRRHRLWEFGGRGAVLLCFVGPGLAWTAPALDPLRRVLSRHPPTTIHLVVIVLGKETGTIAVPEWPERAVVLRDPASELQNWYRVRRLPRAVLLDRSLMVRWLGSGPELTALLPAVDSLVAGRPLPPAPEPADSS